MTAMPSVPIFRRASSKRRMKSSPLVSARQSGCRDTKQVKSFLIRRCVGITASRSASIKMSSNDSYRTVRRSCGVTLGSLAICDVWLGRSLALPCRRAPVSSSPIIDRKARRPPCPRRMCFCVLQDLASYFPVPGTKASLARLDWSSLAISPRQADAKVSKDINVQPL